MDKYNVIIYFSIFTPERNGFSDIPDQDYRQRIYEYVYIYCPKEA